MHTQENKQKAIQLRKEGYSYSYILSQIPIAKSTLSDWLKNVSYIPNSHTAETIKRARVKSGNFREALKARSLTDAETEAIKDVGSLSKRDIMMMGLGLYIGEGSKTLGITRVTNSDPRIIKFCLKWFKTSFGLSKKNIRIRLHLYPDNNVEKSIKYWSKQTGISQNQFFPSMIDRRLDKKQSYVGKLPYGTAHMTVKGLNKKKFGVYLHRRIMAWINLVLC